MKKQIALVIVILSIGISAKSQITWSMGMNVSSDSYNNMHPRITMDGSGNPLVIWGSMIDESVFFSRWSGSVFTTPVKLNPSWLTVATASWMGPDIAAKGDTVYVVMKQTPESESISHIYIVTSFDGGITFSVPKQVDFIADSLSRFPAVTVDANGNPIVAFMKFDNMFADSRWAVTKSTDYGNTFSTDVKASGWSGADALVCDCCPGGIVGEGNNISMLYRNNQNNIRDSWASISTDGGTSFIDGWNVDQNNWNLISCPATGPDGVIIGDSLYAVFMNGESGLSRVYRSTSSISGFAAQPSQLVTGDISGLGLQNYPRIDKSGNAIAIVWKQNVNGEDQLPILFTNDINNGFPETLDTVDLNDITNADIALSNGNIFVVWEDDNSGTVKYRKGTYTVSTSVFDDTDKRSIEIHPNPADDAITISNSAFNISNEVEFLITDLVGRKIIVKKILANDNEISINTEQLINGVYFLSIGNEKKLVTNKIIIQHK